MNLYDTAVGYSKLAVDEDQRGNAGAALNFYKLACEQLLQLGKAAPPEHKQGYHTTVSRYLDRIEQLTVALVGPTESESVPRAADAAPVPTVCIDPDAMRSLRYRTQILDRAMMFLERGRAYEKERKYRLARDAYQSAESKFAEYVALEMDEEARGLVSQRREKCQQFVAALNEYLKAAATAKICSAAPVDVYIAPKAEPPRALVATPRPKPSLLRAAAVQHNPLSAVEDRFLRSSTIDGTAYPMWDDPREGILAEDLQNGGAVFSDKKNLVLSMKQKARGAQFVRPADYLLPKMLEEGVTPQIIVAVSHFTISQSVVGDCSFVSSLTVCSCYEQRFNRRLITRAMYPQDEEGNPVYNPLGKYAVKMLLNGTVRKIVIDDKLPVEPPRKDQATKVVPRLLCAHSTNSMELWVSLMEKAYLKANGGSYEFPGSNSGADLYALCGWIPDLVALDSPKLDRDLQWQNLLAAHSDGKVLMTICTAEEKSFDPKWEEKLGLISGHAYAVLELREVLGYRLLLVKNPWTEQRWLGRFSHQDHRNWTEELTKALNWEEMGQYQTDNGIFWIDWNDVCAYFSRIHISWNPYSFTRRVAVHGRFEKILPENHNYSRNPQYHLYFTTESPTQVWLLLSRHTNNTNMKEAPFITLHIVDNNRPGGPVVSGSCQADQCKAPRLFSLPAPERHTHIGVYRNTPQYLAKLECAAGTHDLTVVISLLELQTIDFSLTVYSSLTETVLHPLPSVRHTECAGFTTCFSPALPSESYADEQLCLLYCPQYRLVLTRPAHLVFRIETVNQEATISAFLLRPDLSNDKDVVWRGRVDTPRPTLVVARSVGRSATFIDTQTPKEESSESGTPAQIPPGTYTLAVHTTHPTGRFAVRIECSDAQAGNWSDFKDDGKLAVVAKEGTGALSTTIEALWVPSHAGHTDLRSNPVFTLSAAGAPATVFCVRLRVCGAKKEQRPAAAVFVFAAAAPNGNPIASSGAFHSYPAGAVISSPFPLPTGQVHCLVAAPYEGNVSCKFNITVVSDKPVAISRAT
eukprot:TRINITY_DN14405_c0_g1_i1.p1 TRINITY_DN14405_c0_g1~~TRINITY_DN14405_c0_g1_i1.p1  ORF type:complete len:1041 (-),score=138.95 TRINITY_DN14405_c0_g1_i1:5-3100(-)